MVPVRGSTATRPGRATLGAARRPRHVGHGQPFGVRIICPRLLGAAVPRRELFAMKRVPAASVGILLWVSLLVVLTGPGIFRRGAASGTDPVSSKYHFSVASLYPDLNQRQVEQLLQETWVRPLVPAPDTGSGFREGAFHGTYVTVNRVGFREVPEQGPWPPMRERYFTVFLFGGSSAFNYGLPDHETIAAYLQERLAGVGLPRPPRVYNFGVAYYTSTQERQLFAALVRQGTLPDLAIFLDGMNDFHYARGQPPQASNVDPRVVRGPDMWSALIQRVKRSPLANLLRAARNWLLAAYTAMAGSPTPAESARPHAAELGQAAVGSTPGRESAATGKPRSLVAWLVEMYYNNPRLLRRVIARYRNNKAAIEDLAEQAGVRTLFIWQPVPTYHYDLRYHPFTAEGFADHTYSIFGYPLMAEEVREHPLGPNFRWCADIQEGTTEPLYIDKVHYSAKFSRLVAGCIAEGVRP